MPAISVGGNCVAVMHRRCEVRVEPDRRAICIDSQIPELLTLANTINTGGPKSTRSSPPASLTPAPRATTCSSHRSTRRLRIPKPTELGPPDGFHCTATSGPPPDFTVTARKNTMNQKHAA